MHINIQLCFVKTAFAFCCAVLPFCINETLSLDLRQMQHIHTVCTMNRYTSAACNKTDNLISRHRIAAFGKTDCHIINTLDDNATLAALLMRFYSCRRLLLHLCHLCQQLLICHLSGFLLLVFFKQLVDNLAFLQTTVSHCCIDCIPVTETVFAHNRFQKLWFRINPDLISL